MKNFSDDSRVRIVYAMILILTLFSWFLVGGMLSALLGCIPFFRSTESGIFIRTFVPHIVMLLTLSFLSRKLFGHGALTLVSGGKADVFKFISAALITLLVYTIAEIISRENIVLNTENSIWEKIFFACISLLLFLPQTAAEEAVFRVLPERIWKGGRKETKTWEKIMLALLCGLFFVLPHLMNVEVTSFSSPVVPVLTYFLWGFLSSLLGQTSGTYTHVWAMHYTNNLFSVVLIATKGTTLSGAPLFYTTQESFSPYILSVLIALFLVIFILEGIGRRKRKGNEEKPHR